MSNAVVSGVYAIRNKVNDKRYIGSSVDIHRRLRQHKAKMQRGTHENTYLQNAYRKYGYDCFEYSIIEISEDKSMMLNREQFWINHFQACNPKKGYNLTVVDSNGCPAVCNLKFSDNEIVDILILYATTGINAKELAKSIGVSRNTMSDILHRKSYTHVIIEPEIEIEISQKISSTRTRAKSILTEEQVSEIRRLYKPSPITHRQLAEMYGVKRTTIYNVLNDIPCGIGRKKLSLEQENEIKLLYSKPSISIKELARKYNVSQSTIGDIVNKRHWINV